MKGKLIENDILNVMLHPGKELKYHFKTEKEAKDFFDKAKVLFNKLPDFIKPNNHENKR